MENNNQNQEKLSPSEITDTIKTHNRKLDDLIRLIKNHRPQDPNHRPAICPGLDFPAH